MTTPAWRHPATGGKGNHSARAVPTIRGWNRYQLCWIRCVRRSRPSRADPACGGSHFQDVGRARGSIPQIIAIGMSGREEGATLRKLKESDAATVCAVCDGEVSPKPPSRFTSPPSPAISPHHECSPSLGVTTAATLSRAPTVESDREQPWVQNPFQSATPTRAPAR